MSDLPFSDACERNREPILGVLQKCCRRRARSWKSVPARASTWCILREAISGLTWQPSDRSEYLAGLSARIRQQAGANVLRRNGPGCDRKPGRPSNSTRYIPPIPRISWTGVPFAPCLQESGSFYCPEGPFCLYGPFNESGSFTSKSNQQFDSGLRARDPGMGIRDLEAIESLASDHHMELAQQFRLPANNSLLVFRKNQEKDDV